MIYSKTLLLIFIILFTNNLLAQSSLGTFNLNGKISSISEHTLYLKKEKKTIRSSKESTDYFFNQNGYLTKVINVEYGDCRYNRSYNDQGNLVEEMCQLCGLHSKKVYAYNENQLLIKIQNYDFGQSTTELKYNESNQLASEEYRDSSELVGPQYRWIVKEYVYNKNGNLETLITRSAETTSSEFSHWKTETYLYDSLNRLVSIFMKDSSLTDFGHWKKKSLNYDGFGSIINETEVCSDSTRTNINYDYFDKLVVGTSKMVHSFNLSDNSWQDQLYECKYDYDNHGNCIYRKENSFIQRFEYEYDNYGNWIKEIYYLDSKAIAVTHRKINYF